MTLLNVERIKLTSTRSPWWCAIAAAVLSIGLAALVAGFGDDTVTDGPPSLTVTTSQGGTVGLGLVVIMVMATLAVTTEYRFGIIRTSFQASPSRSAVILNKALLLGVVAAVIGEILAFSSWYVADLISNVDLGLSSAEDWRQVAGVGLVYGLSAMLAVAVGALLRQSAAAITILLLWPLVVEPLISIIPSVGEGIYAWLPFANANNFLDQGQGIEVSLGPWASLGYFALVVAAFLGVAVVVVNKRDA